MNFVEIIKTQLENLETTPIKAATAKGLHRDTIRSVMRGQKPSIEKAAQICEALELEFYIGPPRRTKAQDDQNKTAPRMTDQPVLKSDLDRLKKEIREEIKRDLLTTLKSDAGLPGHLHTVGNNRLSAPAVHVVPRSTKNSEAIELMELDAATGGRLANLEDSVLGKPIWFRDTWIDRHKIDTDQSVVISVRGDCMDPTLPDGSKILVDRSRRLRRPGRIYVVMTNEGLVLKRIVKSMGEWVMVSDGDSEAWPDMPWPDDASIVGEVKWMSRAVP